MSLTGYLRHCYSLLRLNRTLSRLKCKVQQPRKQSVGVDFIKKSTGHLSKFRRKKLRPSGLFARTDAGAPVKKTIFWHIGDPKTGTSSIQRALETDAIKLDGHLIAAYKPNGMSANAFALAKSILDYQKKPNEDGGAVANRFSELRAWADQSSADCLVVSAEHLFAVEPELLKRLTQQFMDGYAQDCHVVSYIRPHASRYLSAYLQRVKTGKFRGPYDTFFEHFRERHSIVYAPRIEKWSAAFGDQFIVRPFVRDELFGGDVVQDFAHHIANGAKISVSTDIEVNKALSQRALSGLTVFHSAFDSHYGRKNGVSVALARCIFHHHIHREGTPLKSPELDSQTAKILHETFLPDALKVDEGCFGKPVMVTELDKALEKAQANPSAQPIDLSLGANFAPEERMKLQAKIEQIAHLSTTCNLNVWRFYLKSLSFESKAPKSQKEVLDANRAAVDEMDALLKDLSARLR